MPRRKKNLGRPPKYKTPGEFADKVDEYIAKCKRDGEPVLLTGMVLHLGFCDKSSLYDYRDKPEFFHPVKRALSFVENAYERRLVSGEGAAAAPIFGLKQFGWKDTLETDNRHSVSFDNMTDEEVLAIATGDTA